jgi:predicted signal transduction protein with EAL and GGDEF domain
MPRSCAPSFLWRTACTSKSSPKGVETSDQLEFLKSLGCDQYQGFHFSTPVSADAFEQLLRKQDAREPDAEESEADRTHSKLALYRTA